MRLDLSEKGRGGYMGYLLLQCTLMPKSQDDKDMVSPSLYDRGQPLNTLLSARGSTYCQTDQKFLAMLEVVQSFYSCPLRLLLLSQPQTINSCDGFVCHDDVVVFAATSITDLDWAIFPIMCLEKVQ